MGYSQDSVAATSKGNLENGNSHLMVGKVQWYTHCLYIPFDTSPTAISPDKNKDMEKIKKILTANKCVHICVRACTHTHTHTHTTHTHKQLK